ncbi:MAG: cytochrome c [Vicinamibacterales bacterium]
MVGLVLLAGLAVGCAAGQARDEAAEGRALYAGNGCAVCHGRDGQGDGPVAAVTTPRPTDFGSPGTFRRPRTVEAVAEVIAAGIPSAPRPMPPYRHLDAESRRLLAVYVLSIGSPPADGGGEGSGR